jgi:hypothetical protein
VVNAQHSQCGGKRCLRERQCLGASADNGRSTCGALSNHGDGRLYSHDTAISRLVGTGSSANVHNAVGVTERIPYQGGQSRIGTPLVDVLRADPIISHRPLCLAGAIDERDRSTANVDAGPTISKNGRAPNTSTCLNRRFMFPP